MPIWVYQDCESNIHRLRQLLDCGIFNAPGHVLHQSAVIEMAILLNDLLGKAENYAARVDFAEHVGVVPGCKRATPDVTDLVRAFRNAIGHVTSPQRALDAHANRLSLGVFSGKCIAISINGVEHGCEFEDDVAYQYGQLRLYHRRHIVRAYELAAEAVRPVVDASKAARLSELMSGRGMV